MNKKSLIIVSLASIAVLMFACKSATTETQQAEVVSSTAADVNSSIVYINTDSLVRGYKLFIDLNGKLQDKSKKVQDQLTSKGRSFERKVADLKDKASKGLMTQSQAYESEMSLQKDQNDLVSYRDQALAELQEEERVMFNNINNDIEDCLKKYNEVKKYSLILTTNAAVNTVAIGDPSLDVTTDVLTELNKSFDSKQAPSQKKAE